MPLFIRTPQNAKATFAYPAYLNVLDRKATAVQRALRRGGLANYEPEFQAALLALCQRKSPSLVFYDVGAHIGLYSALIEVLFDARSIAFEPTPQTRELCTRLRDHNRLRYDIIASAVSSAVGTTQFYLSPKAETSNSLNSNFRPGSKAINVPVTTLDVFTQQAQVPDPHVIKIDVETHEPAVLAGAEKLINRARPFIACEFLPLVAKDRLKLALSNLATQGYSFYHILSGEPRPPSLAEEVLAQISSRNSSWILSPETLDDTFFEDSRRWLSAIMACGSATNVMTEAGSQPPGELQMLWPRASQ